MWPHGGPDGGRVGTCGRVFPSEVAQTRQPVLWGQETLLPDRNERKTFHIKGWKSVISEVANVEFCDTDLSN